MPKTTNNFVFYQRTLRLLLLAIVFCVGKTVTAAEVRTWTSSSGRDEFKGELLGFSEDGQKVILRGENGKNISAPYGKLSKADQEYIRKQQGDANAVKEIEDVVATGIGKNQDAALKNALRNAVSQAAGTLVTADQMIENDELVKDKILSHSSGFVESHEKIGKPTAVDGGFVEVKIRAKVRRVRLSQEFEKLGIRVITPSKFQGSLDGENMYGKALTKIEMKESEAQMVKEMRENMNERAASLEEVLEGYPENVLTAKLVGKPQYDENTAIMTLNIITSIDLKKYEQFYNNLNEALRQIGGRRTTKNFRATFKESYGNKNISELRLNSASEDILKVMPDSCIAICQKWPLIKATRASYGKEFTITWNIYEAGDTALEIASMVAKRPVYLIADLVDKDGFSVLSIKQISHAGIGIDHAHKNGECYGKGVFFFPAMQQWTDMDFWTSHLRVKYYGVGFGYAPYHLNEFTPGTQEHPLTIKIDASLEDLADIKNVVMRFEKEEIKEGTKR